MNKKILSAVGSTSKTQSAMIQELGSIEVKPKPIESENLGDINDGTKPKPNELEDSFVYSIKKEPKTELEENLYSDDLSKFKMKEINPKDSVNEKNIPKRKVLDDINLYTETSVSKNLLDD